MIEHNYTLLYSGIYPDGSLIRTQLCSDCGMVLLTIRRAGEEVESYYGLNQPQVNELAYALLKGNNKFAHIVEDRVLDGTPPLRQHKAPDDNQPPRPVRQGL